VDFSKAVVPEVGQTMLMIRRMGKFFDRSLFVTETKMGGTTRKPRKLYVPADQMPSLCIPLFTTDGQVIGTTVIQVPEDAENNPRAGRDGGVMILPAAEVAKATKRAMAAAPTTAPAPVAATQPSK
jgi:hypothetical protein